MLTFTLAALVAAAGAMIAVHSFQPPAPSNADVVDMRLNAYEGAPPPSLDELELRDPLVQRVLLPLLRRLTALLAASAPEKQVLEMERKLALAGRPHGLSAVDVLALRYVTAVALAGFGLLIGILTGNAVAGALLIAGGGILGIVLPGLWLSRLASVRRDEIQTSLPDALDLLIVSVEAGLTFEAALARVAEKARTALGEEFARVLQETRLGRPYLEALEEMGKRCDVEELLNFIQSVIQSQQLGVGISRILRLQADEIRVKRLQRAEAKGAQAAVKMLLPMIGCIFPTIWIILLGPSLLILIHVMTHR